MMNSILGDLDDAEYYYEYLSTSVFDYVEEDENKKESFRFALGQILWLSIILIVCCIGFVSNSYIIWLLGFQIKRNSFTTFILNLAIADFGYLMSTVIIYIHVYFNYQRGKIFYHLCIGFMDVMYICTHFLMTAISIDRCVAVLFPIWHRCSRPKHLSPAVCASLWICSVLLVGIMELTNVFEYQSLSDLHFLVSSMICFSLITLSTGVLFFKVCLRSSQRNQGRLLLTILITLFCFLILALPLSVHLVIRSFSSTHISKKMRNWIVFSVLLSCLNSSINPLIYFLVGRKKGAQSERSMKVILQNAFNEGEAT